MPAPISYAERYWSLPVVAAQASQPPQTVTIRFDRYRRTKSDRANIRLDEKARASLEYKLRHSFAKLVSDDGQLHLTVHDGVAAQDVAFDSLREVWSLARLAFSGKASPECVQITLQLAVRLTLAEPTQDGLQEYSDAHLGIDCNGFVGNYLQNGRNANDWRERARTNNLADTWIPSLASPHRLSTMKDVSRMLMDPFLLVSCDRKGNLTHRHIAISEPYTLTPNTDSSSVWVIESTDSVVNHRPVGLTASWYELRKVDKHGVFTVYRGSVGKERDFVITALL